MMRAPLFDESFYRAQARNPAFDLLRAAASLCLFNLAFFSSFVETGFYLPETPGLLGKIASRIFLAAVYTGLPAMDLLFALSGFFLYREVLKAEKTPLSFLFARYKRFLPLYLAASIPAFVYSSATPESILSHVLLLDLYNFGPFIYEISSKANYFLYFSFLCVFFLALRPKSALFARPFFPIMTAAAFGCAIFLLHDPGLLNLHFLSFFYGALAATLCSEKSPPVSAFLRTPLAKAILVLVAAWYASFLWNTRQNEFLPLLARIDLRTFLLLTGEQAILLLLLLAFAGPATPPGKTSLPARLFGMASFSFFISWSLYGMILGGSVKVFAQRTAFTMLFQYAAALSVSLLLAWFLFHFFERFLYVSEKPQASAPPASSGHSGRKA